MNEEHHEQAESEVPATEAGHQRPNARFSGSGGVSVAVWKSRNDDGRDRYSVRIDRSYKKDDGTYKSTPYLNDSDLLRAQQLLGLADDWIEQDKAKSRAATTAAR